MGQSNCLVTHHVARNHQCIMVCSHRNHANSHLGVHWAKLVSANSGTGHVPTGSSVFLFHSAVICGLCHASVRDFNGKSLQSFCGLRHAHVWDFRISNSMLFVDYVMQILGFQGYANLSCVFEVTGDFNHKSSISSNFSALVMKISKLGDFRDK